MAAIDLLRNMQSSQTKHAKRERRQRTVVQWYQVERMAYRSATLLVHVLSKCLSLLPIPLLKLHHHQRRLRGILG